VGSKTWGEEKTIKPIFQSRGERQRAVHRLSNIRSCSETSLTQADVRQLAKPIYGDVIEMHWD